MQTFHIARALNIRKRILVQHEVSLECLLNNIEVTRGAGRDPGKL